MAEESALHVLKKGLKAEFDAVRFYLDNLDRLNYRGNKTAIDLLVLESVDHAKWLAQRLLALQADEGGEIKPGAVREALLEEYSMREIYRYEEQRTTDPAIRKLMQELIAEETKHEKLVDGLR